MNDDDDEGHSNSGTVEKKKYFCCFNDEWCKENAFKNWLRKINTVTAECILCHQGVLVKYEGRRALTSHAENTKHKESEKQQKRTPQINGVFLPKEVHPKKIC